MHAYIVYIMCIHIFVCRDIAYVCSLLVCQLFYALAVRAISLPKSIIKFIMPGMIDCIHSFISEIYNYSCMPQIKSQILCGCNYLSMP